jgi:hypothetical protein
VSAPGIGRADWQREQAELDHRIVTIASRVLSVSIVFFFGGFFFAFVYLRLQNVNGHWNPIDAQPSTLPAVSILATTVLAAFTLLAVRGRLREGEIARWRWGGLVALPLILIAIVTRVAQLWTLGQEPGGSSYVSVLVGWSAVLLAVELGALYWNQTLVARARRLSRADATERAVAEADLRFVGSAAGFTLFWCVLAVIEVVAFVMLDMVH